jgi:hypothetical protein
MSGDAEEPTRPRLYHAKPRPIPVAPGQSPHELSVTGNAGCPAPMVLRPGIPDEPVPPPSKGKPRRNEPKILRRATPPPPEPEDEFPVADIDDDSEPDFRSPKE